MYYYEAESLISDSFVSNLFEINICSFELVNFQFIKKKKKNVCYANAIAKSFVA